MLVEVEVKDLLIDGNFSAQVAESELTGSFHVLGVCPIYGDKKVRDFPNQRGISCIPRYIS